MPGSTPSDERKYWYKISVDAVRVWTALGVVLVLGIGGIWGWGRAGDYLLERRVEAAIDECERLVVELQREKGLIGYRTEYSTARESLERATDQLASGELDSAYTNAERSRSLLRSVLESLRHGSPVGAAQFIAVQGGVEYRRGERGEWREARSRVVLETGDYVKTSHGGSAEVMTVDGVLFEVRPDTIILIDRSTKSDGGAERSIALESGWVNLSTSQTSSRVKTPSAEAVVQRRSEATVTYDESRREGRFAAHRGEIEITSKDGTKRRVSELEEVVQARAKLSRTRRLPEAPMVLAPDDNLELSLEEADRVVLTWEPVPGAAGYSLEVSRNRLFADNIIDVDNRAKTRATLGLRGEGTFIWRVAASDDDGALGPWSRARRFRVSAAPAEEAAEPPEPPSDTPETQRQSASLGG